MRSFITLKIPSKTSYRLLISLFWHCKSEGRVKRSSLYEMDMVVLGCQVKAIIILMYCFATLAM